MLNSYDENIVSLSLNLRITVLAVIVGSATKIALNRDLIFASAFGKCVV